MFAVHNFSIARCHRHIIISFHHLLVKKKWFAAPLPVCSACTLQRILQSNEMACDENKTVVRTSSLSSAITAKVENNHHIYKHRPLRPSRLPIHAIPSSWNRLSRELSSFANLGFRLAIIARNVCLISCVMMKHTAAHQPNEIVKDYEQSVSWLSSNPIHLKCNKNILQLLTYWLWTFNLFLVFFFFGYFFPALEEKSLKQ